MSTRIKNHFSLHFNRLLGIFAFTLFVSEASAQVSAPGLITQPTFNLTPNLTLPGSMSDATNQNLPGWTQRLFGSQNDAIGIDITATAANPTILRFDTRSVASSTSSAADNFTINDKPNYFQYRWNMFRPATVAGSPSTSQITHPSLQGGAGPINSANLAIYNNVLNQILRFDPAAINSSQSGFINPHTGAVIVPGPTLGWFSFEFSNFVEGIGYRNIDLVFTVAPEPGTTLAIAAAGLGLIGGVGRRLRKSKVKEEVLPNVV